jgi:hypothetical protein
MIFFKKKSFCSTLIHIDLHLLYMYFVSCDRFISFREARLMSKVLYIIYGIEYMVVKLYRGLVIHARHI